MMPFLSGDHEPPNWIAAKLATLVWKVTPDCRDIIRLTSEEHDRLLPLGTRLQLLLHRRFCQCCARYAKQLELLHEANRRFAAHINRITGPLLDNDSKARMKRALRSAASDELPLTRRSIHPEGEGPK
jgi:hypothetical protein